MDEERLAQIKEDADLGVCGMEPGYWTNTLDELIAEVRRLRALLDENRARWFDGKGPLRSTATWEPENLD
jgi:hypothetical protein